MLEDRKIKKKDKKWSIIKKLEEISNDKSNN